MNMESSDPNKEKERQLNLCLEKILSSPIFAHAERSQRFLRYIVSETLAGRAEKLKGYTIGLEVFDRDPSFDPALDAIVRVEAARLRGKLREYYELEGNGDPIRFNLPKGNYAIHIDVFENGSPQANGGIASSIPQPLEDKPSLAVLSFINMSSDPEQEYFADGFTDCLITEISRLSGLFVISRQSSFIYKKSSLRAEEIGLELGVRYLLEGSVQRAGGWVRITAQLIDTVSGVHLWAERYDRELKDIFALQDDVIRHIVAGLQIKLTGAEADRFGYEGTSSLEAHDELLRGMERFWLYTPETTEQAKVHFYKAVQLDPGYAAAQAWLARSLVFQWIFFWDLREQALEEALRHAQTAINLDPEYSQGYAVLCWVQCWRRQGDASIAAGRRAVALDPNNADAHLFLAMIFVATWQGEEALRYIKKGMRLNPHPSTLNQLALGLSYFVLERYDEAIAAFSYGVELRDEFTPNRIWLCICHILLGQEEKARLQREAVLALNNGQYPAVQIIWLDEAVRTRARGLLQRAGLA